MTSDHDKPAVTWQGIRDIVLARIRSRTWPPGAMIPNEVDLAEEFGCARATVNRALRDVAASGLLDRRRKAGTRVALTPPRKATFEIPIIRQEVEERGGTYGYTLISRSEGPAPVPVCGRMGLPADAPLLHICALHLSDGTPYMHEERWINLRTVPEIKEVDLTEVSANLWLVQNMPYTHGELSLGAAVADAELARSLACAPASPIFITERCTWIEDAPVTFVVQSYPPGHRITTAI